MDRTIVHAQNGTSRVYQKFMQPSMLSTSQQVWFLQIDKWKDTNIRLSCATATQCKKYYDQKTSYAWKSFHMGVFFCFYYVSRKYLYFKVIGDNIYP